jgi:hypothetical protein
MNTYFYDTVQFNFRDIVSNIFGVDNLKELHDTLDKELDIPDDPSKDQSTVFHKIFYQGVDEKDSIFLEKYTQFVEHLCSLHFNREDMVYQTRPTFRVHIPNNIAVAEWHKDKAYNHSPQETNVFLPLTRAFDTNTVWAESEEDKGDYAPIEAINGQYCLWDGANLTHGNKKNTTGVTRVSIDFRLIPANDMKYSGTSVTNKVPMELGYYWSEVNLEHE